jgi:beta-phosphoglucomutase-like phosphatase (HAD superfamily)
MVAQGKPAPDVFVHAASALGVAPGDCIVVEDSTVGIQAAKAAGMQVIGLLAAQHTKYSWYAEAIKRENPHELCFSFEEFNDLLTCPGIFIPL